MRVISDEVQDAQMPRGQDDQERQVIGKRLLIRSPAVLQARVISYCY